MRIKHAFHRRTLFCLGLGLALLGHLPLAHAIKKADMGKFGYNSTANSRTIGAVQPGNSWQSTGNVGSIPSGHVGSQIGNTGWYVGTGGSANAANGSGPTMLMGHSGDVFFAGTKYPFQAGYQVPVSSIFEAASSLARSPLGIAALLAGPYLYDWINSADPSKVRVNAARDGVEINREDLQKICELTVSELAVVNTWKQANNATTPFGSISGTVSLIMFDGNCIWMGKRTDTQFGGNDVQEISIIIKPPKDVPYVNWSPASMDDIAPYMNTRPSPNIVPEILDKGGDIVLPTVNPVNGQPQPSVTGPSSLPGPSTTTTNPSTGVKTTTSTTYKFTNNDNKVTTTTVINTCTGAESCTDTGDETVITPGPDPVDPCEKNPESIACKEIDTPEGEIPRSNKDLTYTEDTMFSGGGACPADKYMTVHTGQQLKVWDWQQSCSWIVSYVRPVLLVIAAYIALMILVPQT